jgi:hypothetical protein
MHGFFGLSGARRAFLVRGRIFRRNIILRPDVKPTDLNPYEVIRTVSQLFLARGHLLKILIRVETFADFHRTDVYIVVGLMATTAATV